MFKVSRKGKAKYFLHRSIYKSVWGKIWPREYELLTEAHAQLSVVLNCSRFCLPVYCLPPPTPCYCRPPPASQLFPLPQTHTEWGSGAVSDDGKFSVGFCHFHILWSDPWKETKKWSMRSNISYYKALSFISLHEDDMLLLSLLF